MMIAVTGTNGKTSTSFMLRAIFEQAGYKTGLIGTVRCLIGDREYRLPDDATDADNLQTMTTPDPELLYRILREMADEGVQVVILEASSHALALSKLDPIHFRGGIFTNLSPEHLDFHSNFEDYLSSKARLFSMCDIGVFNIDDIYVSHVMQKAPCRRVTCSTTLASDYRASEIEGRLLDGVEYKLVNRQRTFKIKSMIPGLFTVYNTLVAAAMALEMGVDFLTVKSALQKLPGVDGRLERVYLHGAPFSVFIDYAHTPEAMKNLIETVRGFCGDDQRIVVLFGCGGDRDKGKRAPMGKIASKLGDFAIITSDNSRSEPPAAIIRDIMQGVDKKRPHMVIENRREAIEYTIKNARPGDVILLVGKGHETYEINSSGKHPFNERGIVEAAYRSRRQQ
ncbi:MAG: UDP-N-acetylmuramoyl-L-alanyl-D-glutamate--2,6-diaminopimelate ligase [Clostridiales bacterium]|nr:UDP-N-acetylmuramoyl-L-alanyl-D-glutamate--2,6-diaminopimelate ligase [Clostridiales bacterium]